MQAGILVPLIWVGCVQLAALALGRPIYDRWVGAARRTSESAARDEGAASTGSDTGLAAPDGVALSLSALLGFAVLANVALALAAIGLLHRALLIAGTVALAGVAVARILRERRVAPPRARYAPATLARLAPHAPLALAIAFTACFLPNALYPVIEHDDSVYHLYLPRVYLEDHRLTHLPSNLFANMPHLIEVLYTIPMAVGDFVAPKVFALGFAFWTIVALASFARSLAGTLAAGIVALLYVSGKNVQWHFGLAYVEPVIGFFLLGAVLALALWARTGNAGYLRILGVGCGVALASKYSAWVFAAVILLVGAAAALRMRARPRVVLEPLVIAALIAAPWLAKDALLTGNPIYPNAFNLFGGAYWSSIQEAHLLRSMEFAGGPHKTALTMLALPWRLVTQDVLFYCPAFSMALMSLFAAAFVRPSSYRAPNVYVLAVSLAGFAGWAVTVQQGRFLVAWVPVMALAAALALAPPAVRANGGAAALDATAPRGTLRRVALGLVLAAVLVLAGYQLTAQLFPFQPRTEALFVPRAELLPKNGNFALCDFLESVVPPDKKVLVLWDNRFFFLDRRFEADSAYEAPTGLARLRAAGSASAFAANLAANGFTHVVINHVVASSYFDNKMGFDLIDDRQYPASRLEDDRVLMTDFVSNHLEMLQRFGNVVAFRLRAAS